MIHRTILAAVGVTALLSTACTTTRVVGIDAHPAAPALHVESQLWQGRTLLGTEFWSCVDQGTQIVCQRVCGPKMELRCPAAPTIITVY